MIGKHLLLDLENCDTQLLNDVEEIENILLRAAIDAGATVVNSIFHKFEPQGVTGILVLAESHLSIHTYPENGKAYIDCFTCGDHTQPLLAGFVLENAFGGKATYANLVERG